MRKPALPPQVLLQLLVPAADAIALGTDAESGEATSLPVTSITRNISAEAETGQGKSGFAQELMFTFPFNPMSLVLFDYIGTGFDWSMRFVAFTATVLQLLERLFPITAGAADWFLRRHAFAVISQREESDVKIDILKRRRRPDGSLECVAEVVDRMLSVFSIRFDDMNVRVRFRRVATAVFACLSAGHRSISEYRDFLCDPLFRGFVFAEIRRVGADDDAFVVEQIQEIERLLALSPREFEERTESFFNAMQDYAPGTVLGAFFGSEETFDPSLCVFGDARLFVTTDLANPLLRREAFLALHALVNSLFALRRVGTGDFSRCFYILDECAQWIEESIWTLLAMGRNLKVSTFLLYQSIAQWKAAGFPHAPEILPSVCRLRAQWRPTTFEAAKDLAIRSREYDPMGMVFTRELQAVSNGKNVTDTITTSWSETTSRARGGSETYGTSDMDGSSDVAAYDRLGEANGGSRSASRQRGSSGSTGSSYTDTFASMNGTSQGRALGRSIARTLTETLIRIPTDEQVTLHAQMLMRQREHRATWMYEGKSVTVDMYPPRQYPKAILGVSLDEAFAAWRRVRHAAAAERRPVFSRAPIHLVSPATPIVPTPSPVASHSVRTAPAVIDQPPRVETYAFPPLPIPEKGIGRTIAILQLAHAARQLTVHQLMALTRWSYDKAYRALDGLADASPALLDRVRPFAARGKGSAPTIYLLSTAGARLLVAHGGEEKVLLRIAKNGADQRRAIEEVVSNQGRHRAYGATLLVYLAAAGMKRGRRFADVRADREVFERVNLAPYVPSMPDRERPDPTKAVTYIPDVAFTARAANGERRYYIEIETGYGQRDERELARMKAWRLRALHDAKGDAMPEILVWARSVALEARFIEGAAAVAGAAANRIWTTNGEVLPLGTPPGVTKTERTQTVLAVAEHAAGRVWRRLGAEDREVLFT